MATATLVPIIVRTDLPGNRRKPCREAVQVLYRQIFKDPSAKNKTKNALRAELCRALKLSLDSSFKPHWHVLVGEKSGFACKKRNESMAIFRIEENQVVIWQSPGIEELEAEDTAAGEEAAKGVGGEAEGGEDKGKPSEDKDKGAGFKVLVPSKVEKDSEEAAVIAALKMELESEERDPQKLATQVRKRLTKDFGTIWHVIAGSDFEVMPAVECRNHILVTAGKTRLVCFQHEQFMKNDGIRIHWGKLFRSAPYLLLTIFCLGFMTMQAMCGEEDPNDPATLHPSKFRISMREKLCQGDWENRMHNVGIAAVACLFFSRFTKRMGDAKEKIEVKKMGVATSAASKKQA